MLVSLNEIKKYVSVPSSVSTDELIKLIGSRLVEVEESINLAPKYRGIYIVKVKSAMKIEGTHLTLCKIDAGEAGKTFAEDYARKYPEEKNTTDENLVQVVCGAPNVHEGMLAVWITPGAVVPSTYGNENFRLDVRKLQGYESYGMLSGADELGLDNEHKFIAEIDPKMAKPGDAFADVFDLNDTILDIENKSLTHRPDTFGLIGFAREVAGILGQKFIEPEFAKFDTKFDNNLSDIEVKIEDTVLCPRYSLAVIEADTATEKNKYLTADAIFLAKAGGRSISKIVDATNIVMFKTGQPLHAFDYDKFVAVGGTKNPKINIRAARSKETLKLLDGKTIELLPSDIVICSNDIPVALAGAMGGESTEIDESTKRVILESATFSLYNERKMQMAHGIFSEAITRFTKGQPISGTTIALESCVSLLTNENSINYMPNARLVGTKDSLLSAPAPVKVKLTVNDINSLLGTSYNKELIIKTLENVNFKVDSDNENLVVSVPAWRTDIAIKEDIIEEVGRLLGFDNIPINLPNRPFIGAERNDVFELKRELRNILADRLGAHELLTYSFVSKDLIEKVGEDPKDAYEIVNSISPELQRFRISIVPSLIDKCYDNLKAGHKDFALFEFNEVTRKSYGLTEVGLTKLMPNGESEPSEGVPTMENRLGLVITGDYYDAKAMVEMMLNHLHIKFELAPFKKANSSDMNAPFFEPLHSAGIYYVISGDEKVFIGNVGEIKNRVLKNFKIDQPISAFEIDLDLLETAPRVVKHDNKISKFPSSSRDLTLKVSNDTNYNELENMIKSALNNVTDLVYEIMPVSIYQAENNLKEKHISFRITFASLAKTLESSEISAIMNSVEQALSSIGAETI